MSNNPTIHILDRIVTRRRRSLWTALALVAVASLSGHLLLEWHGRHDVVQVDTAIGTPDGLDDCPLCRIISLGGVDAAAAFVPVASVEHAPVAPHPAPVYCRIATQSYQPRAPPS